MPFDLAAYLSRVSLPVAPDADEAGLLALQRAHRLAIPFENLDIALGRGIAIDGENVFAKLVTAARGGYCFEHNRLFLDALDALGFEARPLLGRVWLGADAVPPLTHTFALVTIDGRPWLADAGFGGSYAPPMPLAEGEEADAPDGARFRLSHDPAFGWMLERNGDPLTTDGRGAGPGWQRQYSFTLDPVHPADLALANHWTSTAPASRFVQRRIASIVLPRGFARLDDRACQRRSPEETSAAEIGDARAYREQLGLTFGIRLADEDVAALGLFDQR